MDPFAAQTGARFFSSPQESVEIITQLLGDEDWETLSSYYRIESQSRPLLDSLLSGDYYVRKEPPETAHPAGFWKYRHPFPPGFTYAWHEALEEDVIRVHVAIEIDQGDGTTQQGQASYLMIRSRKGYQLLPLEYKTDKNTMQ